MQLFASTQTHFAAVSKDGRLKIWDVASGSLQQELKERDHLKYQFTALAWTQSKKSKSSKKRSHVNDLGLLALGTTTGAIVIWDLTTSEIKLTIDTEAQYGAGAVQALAFNPHGTLLYSSSRAKYVLEWNLANGQVERKFRCGSGGASALAVAGNGEILAAGGSTLRLFDLSSGKKSRKFIAGLSSAVTHLKFASTDDGVEASRFLLAATAGSRFFNLYDLELTDHDAPALTFSLPSSVDGLFATASLGEAVTIKKSKKSKKQHKQDKQKESFKPVVHFLVGVTAPAGAMFLWAHKYQQVSDAKDLALASKPLSPTLSTKDKACILLAEPSISEEDRDPNKRHVLVARGSLVKPVFEKVSLVDENAPGEWKNELEFVEIDDALLLKAEHVEAASRNGTKRQKGDTSMEKESTHVPTLSERRGLVQSMTVVDDTTSGFDKLEDAVDEEDNELTLAERVEALRERVEGDVTAALSRAEQEAAVSEHDNPDSKPNASSLASVLEQALQARDNALLEYCLRHRDTKIISRTVARVSASRVLALLEVIVCKLERSPNRFSRLCPWLRAILLHHTAYLVAQPDLVSSLAGLYQLLETRLQVHDQMQKLAGRLALVLGQIQVQTSASMEPEDDEPRAAVVYHEGEEEVSGDGKNEDGNSQEEEEGEGEEEEEEDDEEEEDEEEEERKEKDEEVETDDDLTMMAGTRPPTVCRPQHLDRERLRVRLGPTIFHDLIYQEAAIVSTAPLQFQLLALTHDALLILPLLERSSVVMDLCLPLETIHTVVRVVPATKHERRLLLLPTSQLFCLQMRQEEGNEKKKTANVYFATFEPQTQLVFHLLRALHVNVQKQLMAPLQRREERPKERSEWPLFLEKLAFYLVQARNDLERRHLLNELLVAATSSQELRELFFQDRTRIECCTGLAAYLRHQLSIPLAPRDNTETSLQLVETIVEVFNLMCFDMDIQASSWTLLGIDEMVPNLLARGVESYALRGKHSDKREHFINTQAALLLALDRMQEYRDFHLHQHQWKREGVLDGSRGVLQHALQASVFPQWLHTFFKKTCIAVSRAAIAIERQQELESCHDEENTCTFKYKAALEPVQLLALWRNVTLLELFMKTDRAGGGGTQTLRGLPNDYLECVDFLNLHCGSKMNT